MVQSISQSAIKFDVYIWLDFLLNCQLLNILRELVTFLQADTRAVLFLSELFLSPHGQFG